LKKKEEKKKEQYNAQFIFSSNSMGGRETKDLTGTGTSFNRSLYFYFKANQNYYDKKEKKVYIKVIFIKKKKKK